MLRIDGVWAGYGATEVLRDVRLVVPDASVVALLGANGAGKTTLLRVAAGLVAPSRGHVRIDDHDLTAASPARRVAQGMCLVPEGRGIFPTLTVRENLRLQAIDTVEGDPTERAVDAFPRLGERLGQLAGTMSGGEQQMLALARAYIQRPSVVLLDEVSMGLSPLLVDEIFEFLRRLSDDGASLLLVEQYVTRALELADYVYLLHRGQVAFAGEPTEIGSDDVFAQYLGAEIAASA